MAFVENVQQRQRRAKVYQDAAAGLVRWSGGGAALHYEATPDSGVYDANINMTPDPFTLGGNNGWRVTANGWHYFIGQPAGKATDGWVGFGGRQGEHWFSFRLVRLGYLRSTNRSWFDIGGAPTYNRTNLSRTVQTAAIGPNADALPVELSAQWNSLWTTPGGGDVSVRWRAHGDGLKEEIIINQAAREWIAANRPPSFFSIPANQAYFGFVFQLDWSDIPRAYRNAALQDFEGDFADDGQPIELRDALDRLLAFMPIDEVFAGAGTRLDPYQKLPLRKRFYKDTDGNYYLAIGILATALAGLKAGQLVFDPTINEQVGASTDDGYQTSGGQNLTSLVLQFGDNADPLSTGMRFTSVNVPQGTVLTSAILTVKGEGTYTGPGTMIVNVHCDDADNAPTFGAGAAQITSRALTTAFTAFDIHIVADETDYSVNITSAVQEVIDRAGFVANNAIAVIAVDSTSPSAEWNEYHSYDGDPAKAPKLDIVYAAGGATSFAFPPVFRRMAGIIVR